MHDDWMASSPAEYWERRREITPSPQRLAVADGDRRLALVVPVTEDAVRARYGRLRERIDDFECVLPAPPSELHLTVKTFDRVRGQDSPSADGLGESVDADHDTGTERETDTATDPGPDGQAVTTVDGLKQLVRETVGSFDSFDVTFPRLNLFPDTVYAEADAGGALSAMNRALCEREETRVTDRDVRQYVPHLTVGRFTGASDYDGLVDFLEDNRALSFPPVTVSEVALVEREVTADWQSGTATLQRYSLSD